MTHSEAAQLPDNHGHATDPVCGMRVRADRVSRFHRYEGRIFYFCSQRCLDKFTQAPGKYVAETDSPAQTTTVAGPSASIPATEYTCSMHPEVTRHAPGSCPIC